MNYKTIYILIGLILSFNIGISQNKRSTLPKNAKVSFHKLQLDKSNLDDEVITFIEDNIKNIGSFHSNIKIIGKKESLGGVHLAYEQYFADIPIYNSQSKVNLDKNGVVRSCLDNSFDISGWDDKLVVEAKSMSINHLLPEKYVYENYSQDATFTNQAMIFFDAKKGIPIPVLTLHIEDRHGYVCDEALLNLKGAVVHQRSLIVHFAGDSTVKAKVFFPDPLTTARKYYGSPYVDNDDANISALNDMRKTVDMKVNYTFGTFSLYNSYFKIIDFEKIGNKDSAVVTSTTPFFYFNRGAYAFEDVNAFYHLNRYLSYVKDTLGFTTLVDEQIRVDPHGTTSDASWFSGSGSFPELVFGVGGVDDAEDADVIIHEFGHALSNFASPGTNSGDDRKALDEGLGDYLAAGYSRDISEFRWSDVFTWDGHNEFMYGRTASNNKHYPEDTVNTEYHYDGEIWSAVLMQIRERLGSKKTDQLVLQSIYSWSIGMTMKTAAQLVILSDSILNGGANSAVLQLYFAARGLIDLPDSVIYCNGSSYPIDAGPDTTIYRGDLEYFNLGGQPTGESNALHFNWYPATGLNDNTLPNPIATLDNNITYTLRIEYPNTPYNCFVSKTISIDIKNREENQILYEEGFMLGSENLSIRIPTDATSSIIEVFDIYGRLKFKKEVFSNYDLSHDFFNTGVFIVHITSQGKVLKKTTKKIIKVQ